MRTLTYRVTLLDHTSDRVEPGSEAWDGLRLAVSRWYAQALAWTRDHPDSDPSRDGAMEARLPHKQELAGSIPAPAIEPISTERRE